MARTNVPLTTIFTPPADCLNTITYLAPQNFLVLGANSTCVPPGAGPLDDDQIFSPAWNCPSGWTVVQSTVITVGNSITETVATCCPLISQLSLPYGSDMVLQTQYYDYPCQASYSLPSGSSVTDVISNSTQTYTSAMSFNANYTAFQATSVQIAWQASDLLPKSSSSSTTASATSSASTSASSSAAASSNSGSGGLSTTAKIIIGVVVPVVVIAALILLGIFILRRRKSKQRSTTHEIQQEITQHDPAFDSDPHAANRMMMNDGYYGTGGNTPSTYVEKSPQQYSRPTTVSLS